jgi:hypothetical protein
MQLEHFMADNENEDVSSGPGLVGVGAAGVIGAGTLAASGHVAANSARKALPEDVRKYATDKKGLLAAEKAAASDLGTVEEIAQETADRAKSLGDRAAEVAKTDKVLAAHLAGKSPKEIHALGVAEVIATTEKPMIKSMVEHAAADPKTAEAAAKAAEAAAKNGGKVVSEAEKAAEQLSKVTRYTKASWWKKPFVAFGNASGKAKLAIVGVTAVTTIGTLMLASKMRGGHADQITAERETSTLQPGRA